LLAVLSFLFSPFIAVEADLSESDGVGGASLRGGMRSLIASSPLASAKEVIL
jgi:hypothetical protein